MKRTEARIQAWIRLSLWNALKGRIRPLDEGEFGRSAMVFAPHPDDETLGCGGTILKKTGAGAEVWIVFVTNGERSHRHLMPENRLGMIRAGEGRAAAAALGVPSENVIFLGLPNGRLANYREKATKGITRLLARHRPQQLFVPYRRDQNTDHCFTRSAVYAAANEASATASVYEYPIWFWTHWPWACLPRCCRREIPGRACRGLLATARLLGQFRSATYIGDVLKRKRAVLRQYRSQMDRLIPHPDWITLRDVANGSFLKCFFREYELFSCCRV